MDITVKVDSTIVSCGIGMEVVWIGMRWDIGITTDMDINRVKVRVMARDRVVEGDEGEEEEAGNG